MTSYQSYCGALFAPEYLEANPFGYKFSWSPIGVLKALRNSATFLNNNQIVIIPQKNVLHSARPFPGNDILRLISYPNRNSVPYKQVYGLEGCSTVIRGTIRYQGFCEILAGFNDLGLLEDSPVPPSVSSWPDLLQRVLSGRKKISKTSHFDKLYKILMEEFNLNKASLKIDFRKLIQALTFHEVFSTLSFERCLEKLRKVFEGMQFLEMLSDSSKISKEKGNRPVIEVLCDKMKEKLSAKENDRDLVIMVHYLAAEFPGNKKGRQVRSSNTQNTLKVR